MDEGKKEIEDGIRNMNFGENGEKGKMGGFRIKGIGMLGMSVCGDKE
ncbi:hypothetical protein [Bacillus pumilus]|nr:hypothetical protein [Bacillus pumilus]